MNRKNPKTLTIRGAQNWPTINTCIQIGVKLHVLHKIIRYMTTIRIRDIIQKIQYTFMAISAHTIIINTRKFVYTRTYTYTNYNNKYNKAIRARVI